MTIPIRITTPIRPIEQLILELTNTNLPLSHRFQVLFQLKAVHSIQGIATALKDKSVLFKHEVCYVLGQLKDPEALPLLYSVLADVQENEMVRHEAAEAIGAIGQVESITNLKEFLHDQSAPVRETVILAIDSIQHHNSTSNLDVKRKYDCIDPATPMNCTNFTDLEMVLLDEKERLYTRYQAMFALRDIGTKEAIGILAKGFQDSSALFRHEIAYVFGQLSSEHCVEYLIPVLRNEKEHEMVRHEAAEALGSVGSDECVSILKEFKDNDIAVIRESCQVGLGMV
jgi:deoxyhypusine monooxygenase